MTKREVQQRILCKGTQINLEDFTWDLGSRIFTTKLGYLVLDFKNVHNISFTFGRNCTAVMGNNCIVQTTCHGVLAAGHNCKFTTKSDCIFKAGNQCTFDVGIRCMVRAGDNCVIRGLFGGTYIIKDDCRLYSEGECTASTGDRCVVNTLSDSALCVGCGCTVDIFSHCAVVAQEGCIFCGTDVKSCAVKRG